MGIVDAACSPWSLVNACRLPSEAFIQAAAAAAFIRFEEAIKIGRRQVGVMDITKHEEVFLMNLLR